MYCCFCVFFFFVKQKTAYEMLRSLVGSEMCIRDRSARRKVFIVLFGDHEVGWSASSYAAMDFQEL